MTQLGPQRLVPGGQDDPLRFLEIMSKALGRDPAADLSRFADHVSPIRYFGQPILPPRVSSNASSNVVLSPVLCLPVRAAGALALLYGAQRRNITRAPRRVLQCYSALPDIAHSVAAVCRKRTGGNTRLCSRFQLTS